MDLFFVIPVAVLVLTLAAISVVDARTQIIPDVFVIIGAVAGIFFVAGGNIALRDAALGVIAGAAPLFLLDRLTLLVLKKDGFGFGDVKLMAMAGLFLGWRLMLPAFLFAFVSGAIAAIFLLATGKAQRGGYIAFGPFLCAGTLFALWFGENFLAWYFAFV